MAELSTATMLLFFVLVVTELSIATGHQNDSLISLGSSLSPGTNKSYWLSKSGEFAFGFYQQGNGFAVGIWLEKMEEKTVTWTAKRDDPPLPHNITLLLDVEGNLVLEDIRGLQVSISDASQPAASASMFDSGNFVLYNSDLRIIWQSFDSPTDTLLPGQRLKPQNGQDRLVSSISKTDHSSGRFQLVMQENGNLAQYPVLSTGLSPSHQYWNTQTDRAGDNVTLNLDPNGQLYLLNYSGLIIKNINDAGRSYLGKNALYRMTIDVDGMLRLYSHSLVQNDDWFVEWISTNNSCDPTGLCGLNSYCDLNGQQPYCACLPGFDFIDRDQKGLGCERNSSTYGCGTKNDERVTFEELTGIAWEENSYSVVSSDNENACQEECSRDCNCEIALFQNEKCQKQLIPLRFGKTTQGNDFLKTIIKVHDRSLPSTGNGTIVSRKEIKRGQRTDILIGLSCLGFAGIMVLVSVLLVRRNYLSSYKKVPSVGILMPEEVPTLRSFTFSELELATNGFTEQLGRGAFGTVFKGTLPNGQRAIAVKRLEKIATEGEVEFQNEMRSIGKTHHRNLLRLVGYCHEGSNRLLVYDYMSNGSLADFLFKSQVKPNWDQRVEIARGIARGVMYLHEECEHQILHCDINPNNILIDENQSPRIADFGLAKLLMPDQTRTITGVKGTRGFVAPEWYKNLPISAKADVYSFGIVLLVIICCRRSVDVNIPEREAILVDWVYECFKRNEVRNLVHDEEVDEQELERMIKIGLWCIQEEPTVRPAMKKVMAMFEGTVNIPVPPNLSS